MFVCFFQNQVFGPYDCNNMLENERRLLVGSIGMEFDLNKSRIWVG